MQQDNDTIEIVTETATLAKRDVLTGRVRVRTETSSTDELVSAALKRHDVEVTRVAIDREIDAVPAIRTEGDLTVVPVVEEIMVVEKRLVLREEIHIRQTTETDTVELPVTLRKQHAVVERDDVPAQSTQEDK